MSLRSGALCAASALLLAGHIGPGFADAAPDTSPGLALREAPGIGLLQPRAGGGLVVRLPLSVVATGRTVRIALNRAGADSARVVLMGASHPVTLPLDGADLSEGIPGMLRITVRRSNGGPVVGRYGMSYCPYQGWDPDILTVACGYPGLTRSLVAEIGRRAETFVVGSVYPAAGSPERPPAGRYTATVDLDPLRHLPDARRSDNAASVHLSVLSTEKVGVEQNVPGGRIQPPKEVRRDGGRPDLVPAAPEQLGVAPAGSHRILRFDSLFWNRGNAPLVLHGRRISARRMVVVQQVKGRKGRLIARPAGSYHLDHRRGHGHWHFRAAARYELITPAGRVVRRSRKVGFCIGDSTPIALRTRFGHVAPDTAEFCDGARRRTLTMHLFPGWGDLYLQNLPGQAFDVTGLPLGTYGLRITVNPAHSILEATARNNEVVRWLALSRAGSEVSAEWASRPPQWPRRW